MKKSNHVQADPYKNQTCQFLFVSHAIDFSEDYALIVFFSNCRDHEPMYFGVLWDRPHNALAGYGKLCGHTGISLLCTSGVTGVYGGRMLKNHASIVLASFRPSTGTRPPHQLGGAHRLGAPYSSHRVPQRVRLGPSLAAALLDGIFEHPTRLGAAVEGECLDRRVVTRAIDFNGEVGAGG